MPLPFAIARAAQDALQPPGPALLSAQEAKDRLREMVEGFFFRRLRGEDEKRVRRLLVKSPPGLGKTREAIHWAISDQAEQEGKDGTRLSVGDFNEAGVLAQTSIFVPRHHLAEELREVIERAFRERGEQVTVPILRGRENGGEEGNAPCRRWREARELALNRFRSAACADATSTAARVCTRESAESAVDFISILDADAPECPQQG